MTAANHRLFESGWSQWRSQDGEGGGGGGGGGVEGEGKGDVTKYAITFPPRTDSVLV